MGVSDEALSRVAEALNERYEDSLRVVCDFDDQEYRIAYFRDDVRERFGEEAVYEALDEAQLSSLGNPVQERLYGGNLECTVRYFEHVIVSTIPLADTAGIVASFDRDTDVTGDQILDAIDVVVDSRPCSCD